MKPLEVAKIETDRSGMPSNLGANGTFGLARRLSNLAAWAVRHDVISPLLFVLDTCNCAHEHTVYAGTALCYLRQHDVYGCLQNWEAERPFLQDIRRLIDAYAVSPEVFHLHPPMPREKAAYRQLDGLLGKIPVVALIARPVDFSIQDGGWLEAVRAWCFLQHLDAVYNGRLVGKSLATVTDKIRMAIDRGSDWQDLITRLKGPTDSLYGLTQHLLAKSSTLLEDRAEKNCMKPAHRQFLAELRSYCSGRDSTISCCNLFCRMCRD